MENFLEQLILGGSFFLLFIFGIILILMKDNFIQSPKMHRYLGASFLLTACSLLCSYMEVLFPDNATLHVVIIIVALVSIVVCAFIIYKIVIAILNKFSNKVTSTEDTVSNQSTEISPKAETVSEVQVEQTQETEAEPTEETEAQPEEAVETEEVVEEEDEEDNSDTDEDGNPISEPSINNMEDLIFFQKLEALMARKKLFTEQEITREQIASEIGTNRTYLIRSIKLATGMTFNEYITNLRVNYAATLLTTTDEQLDLIGTIAGFKSKSSYYRAFAAANNCSPTEYRNRNK